jgi:hypothetical protein
MTKNELIELSLGKLDQPSVPRQACDNGNYIGCALRSASRTNVFVKNLVGHHKIPFLGEPFNEKLVMRVGGIAEILSDVVVNKYIVWHYL